MQNDVVFPAYQFDNLADAGFDTKGYSLLKFGAVAPAARMGEDLARRFFEAHKALILTEQLIVIPSPYNYVENAATMMTEYFYKHLNRLIYEVNGRPAEYTTIQRKVSYTADYGFLSKADRKGLLDNDQFYLNRDYMEGKTIIFVDDVKITGTHEDKLMQLLFNENLHLRGHFFLYYAQYTGDRAEIESELNFCSGIDSDFLSQMLNYGNRLLIRPIKFILSLEPEEFDLMIQKKCVPNVVIKLYDACLAEGYHYIPKYAANFQRLREYCKQRGLI